MLAKLRPFIILTILLLWSSQASAQPPDNLHRMSQFGGIIYDLEATNDYVYLAQGQHLTIFNRYTLNRVGRFESLPATILDMVVQPPYLYLLEMQGRLHVLDISDPVRPSRVSQQPVSVKADYPNYLKYLTISADYLYLVDRDVGLRIFSLDDPAQPTEVAQYQTEHGLTNLVVVDDYAYGLGAGLHIIDISDRLKPQLVAIQTLRGGGGGHSLAVVGNYVYISGYGLHVIDISQPHAPNELYFQNTVWPASHIVIKGQYAYLNDGETGLRILNITDPAHPTREPTQYRNSIYIQLELAGNDLYVADAFLGLQRLDLTDPLKPMELARYETFVLAQDFVVADGYIYVDTVWKITIIEATNPSDPKKVGEYQLDRCVTNLNIVEDYLYVIYSTGEGEIIDVSDPTTPRKVGQLPRQQSDTGAESTTRAIEDGVIVGNYAYLWGTSNQNKQLHLRVLDVSNPAQPYEIATYTIYSNYNQSDPYRKVAVNHNLVYLSTMDGLTILRQEVPISATVATEGATLSINDETIQLDMPPMSPTLTITLTHARPTSWPGLQSLGRTYAITAASDTGQPVSQFSQPLTLTVRYEEQQWSHVGIMEETLLSLYGQVASDTIPVDLCQVISCTHDLANNRFRLSVEQPMTFALLGRADGRHYLPLIRR